MAARHFPSEEITPGLQFAQIERAIGRVALEQAELGVDRLFQPAPADHAMTEDLEVQRGVGQGTSRFALGQVTEQGQGHGLQAIDHLLQRLAQGIEVRLVAGALGRAGDQADQLLEAGSAILRELAAEQVERLDALGAFVDRVQAVVAVVLLHRVFAGVAVAAEDLDRQLVGLEAEGRGPGLDDGRQQVEQRLRLLAGGFVISRVGVVEQPCGVQAQVESAFYIGFLCQQHTLHVGVLDDRHGRTVRVLVVQPSSLGSLAGVFQRVEIPGIAEHHRAHADADARLVHHLEHAGQALVRLADQVADALAVVTEVERGGCSAAPAHLVE
ncbi:hypothetical protein D3C76_1028610 [compost metagenome]